MVCWPLTLVNDFKKIKKIENDKTVTYHSAILNFKKASIFLKDFEDVQRI